jgi:CRP-like cAMP-binding protein
VLEDEDLESSVNMLRRGCRGILPLSFSPRLLKRVVAAVLQGEVWAPRRAGPKTAARVGMSHRQELTLSLVLDSTWSDSLQLNPADVTKIKVAKSECVYSNEDANTGLYIIKSGRIKTVMLTPLGKQCVLGIYGAGDILGETSLMSGRHAETAIAMEQSVLNQVPADKFIKRLVRENLLEHFLSYLATRIAQHQEIITNLVTADSEYRLASLLSLLARKFGKSGYPFLRLDEKISHQDLADMIGTTRPRVSEFMQRFRCLGLIEATSGSCLEINAAKLSEYLRHRNGL